MSKVFSLILQEEKQREVTSGASQLAQVAFIVKQQPPMRSSDAKPRQTKKDRSLCSYCGVL